MPRTTPLHPLHLAAHAKTVDFGGWDMPLHYGSQVDEHHAVRTDCGVFDVSHMRAVDLSGPGTRDFLRRVLANDVARLATPGKALYSCMLNEAGGVVDDLIVYLVGDDAYRLVVNAGTAEKDLAWLARWQAAEFPGVRIAPRGDLAIVAIQGPRAREKFSGACPAGAAAAAKLKPFSGEAVGTMFVARTGYTGEDGLEVMLPAADAVALWPALVAAGVKPAGLGARDTLRLEAGMNLYGQDMDDDTSPLDAGLAWTVDTSTDRDFVGRRAMEQRGQRHQFLGLVLDGGGILRAHQKVEAAGGEGELTSGTWSPTMGKSIALARLPLDAKPGDTVRVAIRDKKLEARVVKPPFVRAGKILVA